MRFYAVLLFTCHKAFVRFNLVFRLKLVVGRTRHKRVCTKKFNTKYVYLQHLCTRKAQVPLEFVSSFSVDTKIQQFNLTKIQFKTVRFCRDFARSNLRNPFHDN